MDLVGLSAGNYTVKIINILGMAVWSEKYYVNGSRTIRVELDDFKRGTYLYALINDKGRTITTKRLIVLKP
ncbi:MAG: T9SS type A sorting domain-containing protein [Saprospiraceae bacterium]|nr:T9SS type A sorting domain-containing protein [Saprospiraceae bacterium]